MTLFDLLKRKKSVSEKSSKFSRFFREASSREKKKVFMSVARKASDDQQKLIDSVRTTQPVN